MARKRTSMRRKAASGARGFLKKAKKYAKRTASGGALIQLDSMAYGAARRYLSQLVSPLTSKVGMLGELADNAVIGAGMWLLATNTKGIISQVARKGIVAENVLAGDDIGRKIFNGKVIGSTSTAVWG